jgi:hypothetical protein
MFFRKKKIQNTVTKNSVNFDDTKKLLIDIQRLLIRESRKEKIQKIFQ